jgi:hypothetical protein
MGGFVLVWGRLSLPWDNPLDEPHIRDTFQPSADH